MSTVARSVSVKSFGVWAIGLAIGIAAVPFLLASWYQPAAVDGAASSKRTTTAAASGETRREGLPARPAADRDDRKDASDGAAAHDVKHRLLMMLYLHGASDRDNLWSRR